jgi:hypothetical protein
VGEAESNHLNRSDGNLEQGSKVVMLMVMVVEMCGLENGGIDVMWGLGQHDEWMGMGYFGLSIEFILIFITQFIFLDEDIAYEALWSIWGRGQGQRGRTTNRPVMRPLWEEACKRANYVYTAPYIHGVVCPPQTCSRVGVG